MTSSKKFIFTYLLLSCFSQASYGDDSSKTPNDLIASEDDVILKTSDVKLLFDTLNPKQKSRISQNEKTFEEYILKLIRQKKVAKKARELHLDDMPTTKLLIEDAINQVLERQLIIHTQNNITPPAALDQLAKEYYITNPELFRNKEQIKVSHILIKAQADDKTNFDQKLALANEVLEKLKNGLEFKQAVRQYSEDTGSVQNDGSLGYFERGKMVKEFEKAAFNLSEKGQLSDIVTTSFGFHIIKLIDKKESTLKDFSSVKDALIRIEKNKYIKTELKKYWRPFNNNTNTTLYMENLKNLLGNLRN